MKEKIYLRSEERNQLKEFIRRRNAPQWLVQRSEIILKLASGRSIQQVSRELAIARNTVYLWKDRWQNTELLRLGNASSEQLPLAERLIQVFSDLPRPGTPPTFGPEVAVAIVALACRKPGEFGRPISHWTPRELADEAVKQQIVTSISHGSVDHFLKGSQASTSS